MRYKALDLFSGAGGLTEGLKKAGYDVIGAVEIDDLAVETYGANHSDVCVWGDITQVSAYDVMAHLGLRPGELDLLSGCPPCQGFSAMRTKNGGQKVDDPRNDLIFDFLRFVRAFEPKAIMMENVPGLAEDERFTEFCAVLRRLGYEPRFEIQNVADYGVPQRRRRLIMLAGHGGTIQYAKKTARRRTVHNVIGKMPIPGQSGDPLHDMPENRTEKMMQRIRLTPKNGGSRTDLDAEWELECHRKMAGKGFKDVYGRMSWNDVAPTMTTGCFNPSKGRFLHPTQDRNITLREAAMLQSFHRDYIFSTKRGKTHAGMMIGNALPPHFIMVHAAQIRSFLRLKNSPMNNSDA